MSLLCWIIKILICADVNDPHRFRLVKVCRESIIVLPRRSSHRFKVLIAVVIFTGKVDAEEEATEKGNEAKRMMLFKMMFEGLIMWYYNIHKRALNGCKVLKFFRFSSFFSRWVFCVGKQRKNFSLNFFARLMVNSSLFSSCSIFFQSCEFLIRNSSCSYSSNGKMKDINFTLETFPWLKMFAEYQKFYSSELWIFSFFWGKCDENRI